MTPGELRAAVITEADITPYSYRDFTGETIALEEDSDAHTFLRAWEKLIGEPAEIEDSTDNLKSVRCWPSFGKKRCNGGGAGGMTMESDQSETLSVITQHNDMFRTSFGKCKDLKGQIVQTQGVATLGPIAGMILAEKIMRYDNFTEDNDPYGEHDFGSVIIHDNGVPITVWWKIDGVDAPSHNGIVMCQTGFVRSQTIERKHP